VQKPPLDASNELSRSRVDESKTMDQSIRLALGLDYNSAPGLDNAMELVKRRHEQLREERGRDEREYLSRQLESQSPQRSNMPQASSVSTSPLRTKKKVKISQSPSRQKEAVTQTTQQYTFAANVVTSQSQPLQSSKSSKRSPYRERIN
jgi:hypothetical protein